MTLLDMRTRALTRLSEDISSPVTFTAAEVTNAINEGQRLFVLLTLCLESSSTIALTPGTAFYAPRSTFSSWLLPLRASIGGARIVPATLEDLDALDTGWQSRTAAPSSYGSLGANLIFFKGSTGTVKLTYARMPAALAGDSDVPEIPAATHPCLADFAINRVRAKQGGQEFGKTLPLWGRFLDTAMQTASYTRARSLASGYDMLPIELTKADLSRLVTPRRDVLPAKQEVPWPSTSRP